VRIASAQTDLFAADEPPPDFVRVMDLQQEQLARSLGEGHRVIHGVASSGKTLRGQIAAPLLATFREAYEFLVRLRGTRTAGGLLHHLAI